MSECLIVLAAKNSLYLNTETITNYNTLIQLEVGRKHLQQKPRGEKNITVVN